MNLLREYIRELLTEQASENMLVPAQFYNLLQANIELSLSGEILRRNQKKNRSLGLKKNLKNMVE